MSGLLFLTANDFNVTTTNKNKRIMEVNIPGFSLIMFYSPNCDHCKNLLPMFRTLPGTLSGCQFGIININKNKKVINQSRGTITELKVVPYIIMYYKGKPYMRYDGPQDISEIIHFVKSVSETISRQVDSKPPKEETNEGYIIPEYCIARPTKGGDNENICYLNFTEAY